MPLSYKGPFPYMPGSTPLVELDDYTEALADLLNGPAPASASGGVLSLPANVSSWTDLTGIATPARTFAKPWHCQLIFQADASTNVDAWHHLRIAYMGGDGVEVLPAAAVDWALYRSTGRGRVMLINDVVMPGGSTPVVARAQYRTPASSTAQVSYPRLTLFPIRPA